jgi:hypothetical protein
LIGDKDGDVVVVVTGGNGTGDDVLVGLYVKKVGVTVGVKLDGDREGCLEG